MSDLNKIIIRDNGVGVQKSEFKWKILEVATTAKKGGKGIGRFAALQMAANLRLETVAFDQITQKFFKSELVLDMNQWKADSLDKVSVQVQFTQLDGQQASYYQVTISDFYGPEVTRKDKHKRIHRNLQEQQIAPAIFAAYPEKIFQKAVTFYVNGNVLNPEDFIVGEVEKKQEEFTALDGTKCPIDYQFFQVKSLGKHRVFLRVANEGVQTVAHTFDYNFDTPEPNQWFVLADSPFFDENTDVFRNLEIQRLDPSAEHLADEIKKHVDTFFAAKYPKYRDFVQKLRTDSFYPYKNHQPSSETRSVVFSQLAFYVEEQHHLLSGRQSIRELVYSLLDKAMSNRDFEFLLSETIKLDDESLSRFKSLLERSDLEEVIAFSEEVARKQQILDFLHKLNYAEISERVKERSELHKIVEKHLWLFGEQYHGTPKLFSDKNLENNLTALRNELFQYELNQKDENLIEMADEGVRNITDLFFFNENILSEETREIMVVELKAPRVRISDKELGQARRYALQIETQGVFPKAHSYKIILIGTQLSPLAKSSCGTIDLRNPYLFHRAKSVNVEAWAIEWSDLIARNKQKLSYLGNALHTKDKDATEMIETEFKDVNLARLKSELETNKPLKTKRLKK